MNKDELLDELYNHILEGNKLPVIDLTNKGLDLGLTPSELLWDSMIPGLEEVGRLFETGEYFVPEMLVSARAMQSAMDILTPLMEKEGTKKLGKFLMATVKGDMHDIGKNLCNTMLSGAGFEIIDLGINVSPEVIADSVKDKKPDCIGFSAFLTTTMPMFKKNIEILDNANLRKDVKIIVGGAPVTKEYADMCTADGYAKNATECVRVVKNLLNIEHKNFERNTDVNIVVDKFENIVKPSHKSK